MKARPKKYEELNAQLESIHSFLKHIQKPVGIVELQGSTSAFEVVQKASNSSSLAGKVLFTSFKAKFKPPV
jgi:hypothetical protein